MRLRSAAVGCHPHQTRTVPLLTLTVGSAPIKPKVHVRYVCHPPPAHWWVGAENTSSKLGLSRQWSPVSTVRQLQVVSCWSRTTILEPSFGAPAHRQCAFAVTRVPETVGTSALMVEQSAGMGACSAAATPTPVIIPAMLRTLNVIVVSMDRKFFKALSPYNSHAY